MTDRKLSVGLLLVGGTYLGFALRIPDAPIGDPWGPRLFPIIIGSMVVLLSSLSLWTSRKVSTDRRPIWGGGLALALVTGLTFTYAMLFDLLGYIVATLVSLFGLLLVYDPARWRRGVAISFAFSIGAYLLFHILLGVYLPSGILG